MGQQNQSSAKTAYRRAHSLRRQFMAFTREALNLIDGNQPPGDLLMRSLWNWFKTEYQPNAEAANATIPHSPLGKALNWREAYLLHGRDRALLAHYRNRRWFRDQPNRGPVVVREVCA